MVRRLSLSLSAASSKPPPRVAQGLMFSLLSVLCFTLLVQGVLSLQAKRQQDTLRVQDEALINSAHHLLSLHLQVVHTDLRILSSTPIIQRLAAHPQHPELRAETIRFLRNVVREARIYDQLRFIDARGVEQVRIDQVASGTLAVPDDRLQDKSDRYYFQETMRLQAGEIYMSPLDLNIEQGQIELPHKPMVRMATPLFNAQGQRLGLLVVNVLGDWLIDDFRQLMLPGREAIWLNAQGDWLVSPEPAQNWGFMFDRPGLFARAHPALWEAMRTHPRGHQIQADGLWTYTTLTPLQHNARRAGQNHQGQPDANHLNSRPDQAYAWILASRIPKQHLPSAAIFDHALATQIYLGGVAVLLALSWYLTHLLHSRRRFQQQALVQAERLSGITAVMAEGLMVMNPDGKITFINPEALRLLGWHDDELLGQDGHALIHHHLPDGREAPHESCPIQAVATTREVYRSENEVFFRKDGSPIAVGVSAAPLLLNDTLEGTVLVFTDLSRVKAYQAEIQHLAFHDALTNLPNRRLLKDRLAQSLGHAQRHPHHLALMYLDLDHFKDINDHLGHDGGDELLRAVAARLTRSVRATDTVARMGGDEFVVLLPEVSGLAAASQVAQQILDALWVPHTLKGQTLQVGSSIGVALFPDSATDIDTLMQAADQAMYIAKQRGRHRYHVFTPDPARANPDPACVQPAAGVR